MKSVRVSANDLNKKVMRTIRVGLFIGRKIQRRRATALTQLQMRKVEGMLRMARSLILLQPGTLVNCIPLLPQINAFLGTEETPLSAF
jgi:hypothetical protein